MKQLTIILSAAMLATAAYAQNVVDAARFSETTLSGTARYRSMGGALGAVGGDATALVDNPAGLGIYRGVSEVAITPQFTAYTTKTKGTEEKNQTSTGFTISNLTYIISFNTESSSLMNFNIGVGFNHSEGVERKYRTFLANPNSSFGAFLANQANNYLVNADRYDQPGILETNRPRNLIEMAYNSFAIDDAYDASGNLAGVCSYDQAHGLGSVQSLYVKEKTRMEEYNISAAANWSNMFYGGITLSIVDFNSTVESEFSEDYTGTNSYIDYDNNLETKGSGINVKLGMLFKPVDAWRFGLAFHSPTWMYMKDIYDGAMYTDADNGNARSRTDVYEYKYRINTPWELQFSTAYVIGNRGLVSFEYDMKDFSSTGYYEDKHNDQDLLDVTNDVIKDYMQPQHILKVGGELRATPRFSLRAGYQYRTSPFKKEVMDEWVGRSWTARNGAWGDDNETLFSSSTKPNYSMVDDQHYLCLGCGWKGRGWFIDLAFVDQIRKDKIGAFPTTDALMGFDNGMAVMSDEAIDGAVTANHIDMTSNILSWDVTFGFKF